MATRRYGIKIGEAYTAVTEAAGAAVSSDDVELTADLAKVSTKEQLLLAIDQLRIWVIKGNWPPA